MRKLLLSSALIVALSPVAALAQLSSQEIVDMYPGAQRIEIKRGVRTTRVEVTRNGEKIEVVFDNQTNEVRKSETRQLGQADLNDTQDGSGQSGDALLDDGQDSTSGDDNGGSDRSRDHSSRDNSASNDRHSSNDGGNDSSNDSNDHSSGHDSSNDSHDSGNDSNDSHDSNDSGN